MKLAGSLSAAIVLGLSMLACSSTGTASQAVAAKKIALLLPSNEVRYETRDRPLFEAKLLAVCSSCELVSSNANQDAAAQRAQAETALSSGANVLVLDPVDAAAAAEIVAAAAERHVPVIAYDTLVLNAPDLAYYVAFDDAAIGSLQAKRLMDALAGKKKPTVVIINGDPADPRARLLKQGAHRVLDGKVKVAQEYDIASWSSDEARLQMSKALQALKNKVDGVYAASDDLASGAIEAMKQAGISPIPPVTGGDSSLDAIRRILTGDQYMTVYLSIKQEAEAAAQLAYDLAYGVTVPAWLTAGSTVDNGSKDVPAVLVAPVAVTLSTLVSTVLAEGFWTRADICTQGYLSACSAAGVT